MPRRRRMYLPGLTYHLVQRGNNRRPCFFEAEDYRIYLDLFAQGMTTYGVAVHAYVLMTNHIHLLLTPEYEDSISCMTRTLGSRFAQAMNRKYERTGTLWEGRHKSSPVDCAAYLLKCYRYIELNPVVANMVTQPEEYLWSSYRANACGEHNTLVSPHACYLDLAPTADACRAEYRRMVATKLADDDVRLIRRAAHYCQPLGDDIFREQIKQRLGAPVGHMGRGRPRKNGAVGDS